MFKIFKDLLLQNNRILKSNNKLLREIEWAHIYHDSIRGKTALENLSLNVGRWAGNYAFFYVLNRILFDYRPGKIIEFGLGESSKFISTYIDNYNVNSFHIIVEQSDEWKIQFLQKFTLSKTSEIKVFEMIDKDVKDCVTNGYKNIEILNSQKFDLYVIDGPFGSPSYSRYDIVELASNFRSDDEFIILFDDYQRKGEKESALELLKTLEKNNIKIYSYVFEGGKSLMVIATERYKNITSI